MDWDAVNLDVNLHAPPQNALSRRHQQHQTSAQTAKSGVASSSNPSGSRQPDRDADSRHDSGYGNRSSRRGETVTEREMAIRLREAELKQRESEVRRREEEAAQKAKDAALHELQLEVQRLKEQLRRSNVQQRLQPQLPAVANDNNFDQYNHDGHRQYNDPLMSTPSNPSHRSQHMIPQTQSSNMADNADNYKQSHPFTAHPQYWTPTASSSQPYMQSNHSQSQAGRQQTQQRQLPPQHHSSDAMNAHQRPDAPAPTRNIKLVPLSALRKLLEVST